MSISHDAQTSDVNHLAQHATNPPASEKKKPLLAKHSQKEEKHSPPKCSSAGNNHPPFALSPQLSRDHKLGLAWKLSAEWKCAAEFITRAVYCKQPLAGSLYVVIRCSGSEDPSRALPAMCTAQSDELGDNVTSPFKSVTKEELCCYLLPLNERKKNLKF